MGEQPFTGSLRSMIAFGHLCSCSAFLGQLKGRLKKINEEPRCCIEASQRLRRGDTLKPAIADHSAHHGAVLLLDPRLIIFSIRTTTGEFDSAADAVFDQCFIDKLSAVVDVQCPQRKRQADAHPLEGLDGQRSLSYDQWRCFGPRAGPELFFRYGRVRVSSLPRLMQYSINVSLINSPPRN